MLNLREYAEHKNVRSGKDYSGNDWGIVNKDNNFVRPDLLGEVQTGRMRCSLKL